MNTLVCGCFFAGDIVIDERELSARLGMPNPFDDMTVKNLTQQIMEFCVPRFCYKKTSALLSGNARCVLDFGTINSVSLCRALGGSDSAFVTALTLGIEVDRFIAKLSVTSKANAFVADAVASSVAEAAMDTLNKILAADNRLAERFSAGYGDFVLSYQKDILSFLDADKNIGIKLGANYIMTPRKSVTSVIGIMEERK